MKFKIKYLKLNMATLKRRYKYIRPNCGIIYLTTFRLLTIGMYEN